MKHAPIPLVLALAMTTLVSCAPMPEPGGNAEAGVRIVASTNVYGSIAEYIAGQNAAVVSIIDNPAQDPHSFEAGPRAQLEVSKADVVIVNGGGYDDFMGVLLAGAGNSSAQKITAVEVSELGEQSIEQNEHVWYDLSTVYSVAEVLAETLVRIDADHAADYRANFDDFAASLSELRDRVTELKARSGGATVLVTEPVPLYLLSAAGFSDLTPPELRTAIENGNGVPPRVMNSALQLLSGGSVDVLVYNEQTEGPETRQLIDEAAAQRVPAIGVTETIPGDLDYLEWMTETVRALEEATR